VPKVKKVKGPRGRPKMSGPDVVCCVTGYGGAEFHHIFSQKAFPKLRNEGWNKIPLRHDLHYMAHKQGMVHLSIYFPQVQLWLIAHDWYLCPLKRVWRHDLPAGMDIKKIEERPERPSS